MPVDDVMGRQSSRPPVPLVGTIPSTPLGVSAFWKSSSNLVGLSPTTPVAPFNPTGQPLASTINNPGLRLPRTSSQLLLARMQAMVAAATNQYSQHPVIWPWAIPSSCTVLEAYQALLKAQTMSVAIVDSYDGNKILTRLSVMDVLGGSQVPVGEQCGGKHHKSKHGSTTGRKGRKRDAMGKEALKATRWSLLDPGVFEMNVLEYLKSKPESTPTSRSLVRKKSDTTLDDRSSKNANSYSIYTHQGEDSDEENTDNTDSSDGRSSEDLEVDDELWLLASDGDVAGQGGGGMNSMSSTSRPPARRGDLARRPSGSASHQSSVGWGSFSHKRLSMSRKTKKYPIPITVPLNVSTSAALSSSAKAGSSVWTTELNGSQESMLASPTTVKDVLELMLEKREWVAWVVDMETGGKPVGALTLLDIIDCLVPEAVEGRG
ncbi:hypothetical protein HDV05_006744 [Chytridiales sp. JEL 0842]|nr:hypothetical protein HDV05_006744 [Chytridiales sp. JEL 0842]